MGAFLIYQTLFNGQVSDTFSLYSGTGDYIYYVILGELIYIFVVRTFLNVSRSFIVSEKSLEQRINHLIRFVGLEEKADEAVEHYSKGMKQRLQIARGLISNL